MSFRSFLFTTTSIISGGIIVSEYFFFKLDPRLEKITHDLNNLVTKQKEDVFQRIEEYPNKVMVNTKNKVLDNMSEKKNKLYNRLFKSSN